MERLLSIDEAAEVLRVSHWTIRNWIRIGKLPAAKAGERRIVIRERDLKTLITTATTER